jgi:hypothetical protein
MASPQDEQLRIYEQLCNSYRAIDDFRAKLLGFLPLASGGGIFLLAKTFEGETKQLLLPIGAFGFVITLGLFFYEIYGIRKCGALINAGKNLERMLGVEGQFKSRPREVARLVDEPFAAGLIYPAVLAAWLFLALVSVWPAASLPAAILVFMGGFAATLVYDYVLRRA